MTAGVEKITIVHSSVRALNIDHAALASPSRRSRRRDVACVSQGVDSTPLGPGRG